MAGSTDGIGLTEQARAALWGAAIGDAADDAMDDLADSIEQLLDADGQREREERAAMVAADAAVAARIAEYRGNRPLRDSLMGRMANAGYAIRQPGLARAIHECARQHVAEDEAQATDLLAARAKMVAAGAVDAAANGYPEDFELAEQSG